MTSGEVGCDAESNGTTFSALPQNEAFARGGHRGLAVQLNPTLPEMADIKTAVSEAVTNAIVHGYRGREDGLVRMSAEYGDRRLLTVVIRDEGCGIADVEKAMQPFYSTGDGAERSGMGFCVMQTFMDAVEVDSAVDRGTTVTMRKYITGEVGLHRERMLDEIG